jgi:large-conductance mechanosensitive channel
MYLRRKYPNWSKFSSGELKNFAENLATIKEQSETYINSKVSKKFDEITGRFSTIFILLDDVFESLKENPESIKSTIEDSNLLISLIRDHYLERRKTLQRRLRNSAIFSTLSVFISNWATFYLIEVPVARLFYEEFNLLATIIDFLLPALVMFLLVIFIKPPKDENLENVIESSKELLYKNSTYETHELVLKEEKHGFIKIFITFAYTLSTILLFVGIAAIFYYAQLPITSVIYDTFTIAITFYAALGVRKTSKELYVGEKRSFGDFLFDSFTVPLAKVGEFLSSKWKEYNVVAIFTNYLIEIPFVAILDFIELWSKFLKERKSELS